MFVLHTLFQIEILDPIPDCFCTFYKACTAPKTLKKIARGNIIQIKFISDSSVTGKGFHLSWTGMLYLHLDLLRIIYIQSDVAQNQFLHCLKSIYSYHVYLPVDSIRSCFAYEDFSNRGKLLTKN
jgi:hypothetical protein